MKWHAMLLAVCLALGCAPAPNAEREPAGAPEAARFTGVTMGTTYEVCIARLPVGVELPRLQRTVDEVIQSIDARMSTYVPHSELSRFNATASTDWFPVSHETHEVVELSRAVSSATGGAFDVTVGPLVELWGFGPSGPRSGLPTDVELAERRAYVGFELLETGESPPALRKRDARLTVDLSAVAKGFAVDAVARHLEGEGVEHYLVEIGGELRARGESPRGRAWRVAIEAPGAGGESLLRTVQLKVGGLATSGDYRRRYEHDGRRYAHILDPRTGRPAIHEIASATVLAPTTAEADAYATALAVLHPDAVRELALRRDMSVRIVWRTADGFAEWLSPRFAAELVP